MQCQNGRTACGMVSGIVRLWELALRMKHSDENVKNVVVRLIPKVMSCTLEYLNMSRICQLTITGDVYFLDCSSVLPVCCFVSQHCHVYCAHLLRLSVKGQGIYVINLSG